MAFFNPPLPEKLNICLITKKFPTPGRNELENYVWPMANEIIRRGHSLTVLAWQNPRGQTEYKRESLRVFFLGETVQNPTRRHFPTQVNRKFIELHEQTPFHIVHSIDESGLLVGKNCKRFGIAMTYDVAATQMAQIFSILGMAHDTLSGFVTTGFALAYKFLTTYWGGDRELLNTADGVFTASPQQQILLERYYLYPERKTFNVPYGMDYVALEYLPRDNQLIEKLGLPADTQFILTFTDMMETAVINNLLQAFAKVVVKKPNTRLIIIGHGPYKKEIEFAALNLVLGNKTIFTGPLTATEISDFIRVADIYVDLSSRSSGFEASMLESMAQKKIVIGSELSPMSTVIEDKKNGFLIRPADTQTLTQLLQDILNEQVDTIGIGNQARAKVLDLFNVQHMVDRIINAFYEILRRTGRKTRSIRRVKMQSREISA